MNTQNDGILEEALKSTWEAKDRFYEENKHLTTKQFIEKIEGRKYNFTDEDIAPHVPIVFRDLSTADSRS
jgi:hypothetical protein